MYIFIFFIGIFIFLFFSRKVLLKNIYFDGVKTTGKLVMRDEQNQLEFENTINNWIKNLYNNELMGLFVPENDDEILILCSYYKNNNIENTKLVAVENRILKSFVKKQDNLKIFIKKTPKKNIFLSCKINKINFDIILKLPYFHDKPNEVSIITNLKELELIFN